MKIIGPDRSERLLTIYGRRQAKNAELDKDIEAALDAGYTVVDTRTDEKRGANTAKDITPKMHGE